MNRFVQKLDLMKMAATDPLFIADVDSVSKDFSSIDAELLWNIKEKRFAQFHGEIGNLQTQNEIIEALFFQMGIDSSYNQQTQ